jgi:cytoskeletal protein RodZ
MSTKPFKDIEEVIKNASEGYEPPFEEASWAKMEVLLDKEKDRRKPLFWLWWLLPLLIGGSVGGYFILNNEPDKNILPKDIVVVENNEPLSQATKNDKSDVPVTDDQSRVPGTVEPLKSSVKTPGNSAFQQPDSLSAGIILFQKTQRRTCPMTLMETV